MGVQFPFGEIKFWKRMEMDGVSVLNATELYT